MNTTIEFLDAVKSKTGTVSDYALAPVLGITRSAISKYRTGKDFLGSETAIKVANILEIDAGIVAAAIQMERAKSEQEKALWKSVWEKLGGIAAGLVVAVALGSAPSPAQAADGASSSSLYIMSNRKRTRKKPVFNPILAIFEQFVQPV